MGQGGPPTQVLHWLTLESLSWPSFPRYRMIHKPVYKVKQKVLASVAWKCCPGFSGPDCRHYGRARCGSLPFNL